MANNPLGGLAGAAGGIGNHQLSNLLLPAYPPYPPSTANFPPGTPNFIGQFRVRKVENGYILAYNLDEYGTPQEYFAADLKELGEKVTALCVQKELK